MRRPALALLVSLAWPVSAQFTPPLGEQLEVAGPRTQMLTLGSTHLSGHTGKWSKAWLEPLVQRLVDWKPTLITVEQLSGAQCEVLRADPSRYGEVFSTYCRDAAPFQRALGLTQAQAEADAERRLEAWPAAPTPVQRRELAMLFLAAGDPYSAQVQWLRLPPAERRAGDGVDGAALELLERRSGRMNETYDVAAEVAARVGLERLHAVDDHTSDAIDFADAAAFGPWQQARYEAIGASPVGAKGRAADAGVRDAASLLAYYRAMNAAGAIDAQIAADFGGAAADAHPERFGRKYVAWWETRNLRMLANIREATALHPGARVLNVVGASHKPWYDAWARQLVDVDVVDAAAVLAR